MVCLSILYPWSGIFIVINTLHCALSLIVVPSTSAKVSLQMHCHLLLPSTPVLFVHVSMFW